MVADKKDYILRVKNDLNNQENIIEVEPETDRNAEFAVITERDQGFPSMDRKIEVSISRASSSVWNADDRLQGNVSIYA